MPWASHKMVDEGKRRNNPWAARASGVYVRVTPEREEYEYFVGPGLDVSEVLCCAVRANGAY